MAAIDEYASSMLASASSSMAPTAASLDSGAEAARYALLRRLAPSIRHHLVVNLQPIGMIYEVMDRRLRAPEPDLAHVHESAHKINGFARAALNSCLDVVSWLAPDDAAVSTLGEGARECASLLASSLSFRGYALRNEVGDVAGEVRRSAIRNLLTATLILATDELTPPAELLLSGEETDEGARLTLSVRVSDGDKGFVAEPGYRKLTWSDLQALAASEGAELTRGHEGSVSLLLPWAA
jgi:hypothetical protein